MKHLREQCTTVWKCGSGSARLRIVCHLTARYWLKIATSTTLFLDRKDNLPKDPVYIVSRIRSPSISGCPLYLT